MGRERNKARRGSAILLILDTLLFMLTIGLGVLLLFSYFAPYVHPQRVIWFSYLGLAAPFLYLAVLIFMLYWTIRWKPIAIFLLVLVLLGLGHVGKYFKPQIAREYPQEEGVPDKPAGSIRILSYNVRGFLGKTDGKYVSYLTQVTNYIQEKNPDILCLQEYEVTPYHTKQLLDSLLSELKYSAVSYAIPQPSGGGWGLAIYSKFRILARQEVKFEESTNSSMWVDLVTRRDTIRVYNTHLQTTQINEDDREFLLSESLMADTVNQDKAKGILRKLGKNFKIRAQQADSLAIHIHDRDHTPLVIVCGDFNDTPMSYTYHTMRGNLVDAFKSKGKGVVYTYKGLMGLFRIDYVFHSKGFETIDYKSDNPDWSDHNPVLVDVKIR